MHILIGTRALTNLKGSHARIICDLIDSISEVQIQHDTCFIGYSCVPGRIIDISSVS